MRRTICSGMSIGVLVLVWVGIAVSPVWAGMSVVFDTRTLNDVLPALTASEIEVPLSEDSAIGVVLENMQVTGLEPGVGENGSGHILTSMRVRVPQLGLDLPVESKLSLHVAREESGDLLELRFDKVQINLPLAGSIDIATFLPPLQFPAENVWRVEGADGDIRVHSKLSGIDIGSEVLRFEFELVAGPD